MLRAHGRQAALLATSLLCTAVAVALDAGECAAGRCAGKTAGPNDFANASVVLSNVGHRERRQVNYCVSQQCQSLSNQIKSAGGFSNINYYTSCFDNICEDEIMVSYFRGPSKAYICNTNGCGLKGKSPKTNGNRASAGQAAVPAGNNGFVCQNRPCQGLMSQLKLDRTYSGSNVFTYCENNGVCEDTVTVRYFNGPQRIYKCNRVSCQENGNNGGIIDNTVEVRLPPLPPSDNSIVCQNLYCKDFINKLTAEVAFARYDINTTCLNNVCEDKITVQYRDNTRGVYICNADGCTNIATFVGVPTTQSAVTTTSTTPRPLRPPSVPSRPPDPPTNPTRQGLKDRAERDTVECRDSTIATTPSTINPPSQTTRRPPLIYRPPPPTPTATPSYSQPQRPPPTTGSGSGSRQCAEDSDCEGHHICYDVCIDPCEFCGKNALCDVIQRTSICKCPDNMEGDPDKECTPNPAMCPPLRSDTLDVKCSLDNREINCLEHMRSGTEATFECKASHSQSEWSASQYAGGVVCNDGRWNRPLPDCRPDCGLPIAFSELYKKDYETGDSIIDLKVENGEDAKLGMYPWHAGLYKFDTPKQSWDYFCGGSLVTKRVVITAAHCVNEMKPRNIMVALGKVYRAFDHREDNAVTRSVLKIEYPPEFNSGTIYGWDVGLLLLNSSIQLSRYVMPVCRSARYTLDIIHSRPAYVAGWGEIRDDQNPEILQHTNFSIVDKAACRRLEVPSQVAGQDKFCGQRKNVQGLIVGNGDSGGGVTSIFDNKHFIVGVVSINYETTSVFINVTYEYIEQWMKTNLENFEVEFNFKVG